MNDPDTYLRALTALLGSYPSDVVQAVVDPRSGLPSRLKWLPTIAEVKEACEREMAPIYREREFQKQREEMARMLPAPSSGERPSLDELRAKHGAHWGISQDDHGAPRRAAWVPPSIEQMCADAGVSPEEFEAINEEALKWEMMRAQQR